MMRRAWSGERRCVTAPTLSAAPDAAPRHDPEWETATPGHRSDRRAVPDSRRVSRILNREAAPGGGGGSVVLGREVAVAVFAEFGDLRVRSEERRGGKEWVRSCRSRGVAYH